MEYGNGKSSVGRDYPKGTGSTNCSFFAGCRWRCSARGRTIDDNRAEQSPAPTENNVPIAKPTIPFIIIAAGQAGAS